MNDLIENFCLSFFKVYEKLAYVLNHWGELRPMNHTLELFIGVFCFNYCHTLHSLSVFSLEIRAHYSYWDLSAGCPAENMISNRNKLTYYTPSSRSGGSQSGGEKRRDESFQARAEKSLGTDSCRTIYKRSSECCLLIGHKKSFVLLCPIGEQYLLSSFRELVHDVYCLDHGLSVPKKCTQSGSSIQWISQKS